MEVKKKIHKGKIKEIKQLTKGVYYIKIETDRDIHAKAGQFLSILCENKTLRRPFSITSCKHNEVGILFKQKGEGTKYLSELKIGDVADFIAPMGKGFSTENKKSLLIGAGIGVAPILYLKRTLEDLNIKNTIVGAFVSEKDILKEFHFDEISTDDGSFGLKGYIIEHFDYLIKKYQPEKIYACGPQIVLKNLAETTEKYKIPCEIALEKIMACSIGVCRGCVIKIRKNGEIQNATICHDGPVFNSEEIVWQ